MIVYSHEWFTDTGAHMWEARSDDFPDAIGEGATEREALDALKADIDQQLRSAVFH